MKMKIAALALPLAVGLAACDGPTGPSASSLEGSWQLVSLQPSGGSQVPAPSGASFTAEFGADGRLSLVADCNHCGSTYDAGSGTLSVGLMACTLAYCSTAPVDTQFSGLVQASQNWRLENAELLLVSADGTVRLRR